MSKILSFLSFLPLVPLAQLNFSWDSPLIQRYLHHRDLYDLKASHGRTLGGLYRSIAKESQKSGGPVQYFPDYTRYATFVHCSVGMCVPSFHI